MATAAPVPGAAVGCAVDARSPCDQGSANTNRLLPRLKSSCVLPPAATATYCLPLTMYDTAGALTPAPHVELPELLAGARVERLEPAVALAVEHEVAGRGEHAADQRLRRLRLPRDLAGVEVDGDEPAPLLLAPGSS